MGCRVDAAREARDDDEGGLSQLLGQASGDSLPPGRGDACADDADGLARQEAHVSTRPQQGRRWIDGSEPGGIGVVAENDESRTRSVTIHDLALYRGIAWQDVAMTAALADQVGQGIQRALGRAEPLKKLTKGDRADPLCTSETQAGEPLGLRQAHVLAVPSRGSAPFSRRAMFSWCRI